MKNFAILFLLAIPVCNVASIPAEAGTWPEMVDQKMAEMPEIPSIKDMRSLAIFSGNKSEEPDHIEARKRAWERLRAVTDFAERFATHIRDEREKWISGKEMNSASYNMERMHTLTYMGNLPHPSVVKVLGEFLPDVEWPGYKSDIEAVVDGCPPPNAIFAAKALGQLIEKPPVQKSWEDYWFDDAKVWELWYAQVKAGTRTFRFKGDPQEYNLQGPVSKAIEPVGVRPRKNDGAADSAPVLSEKPRPVVPALVAACGVLGAAVWYFTRRRKQFSAVR